MFSENFYKDLYNDLKQFFKRRKANKFRSSNNAGGTDTQEQVVEDIESSNRENKTQSGVLESNNNIQDFNNNVDTVDLSDDVGNTTVSGSLKALLKEILAKIKKRKREKKKKKELTSQIGIDGDIVETNIDEIHHHRPNVIEKRTEKDLGKLIHKISARHAAIQNISRQAQQLNAQEAVKNASKEASKESAKKAAEEKNVSKNAKETGEQNQKKTHEQTIGHFKNDLGSSGKINPLGALSDSAIKAAETAPKLRAAAEVKASEAAGKQGIEAGSKGQKWTVKVDQSAEVSKDVSGRGV